MPAGGPAMDYARKRDGYMQTLPVGYVPAVGVSDMTEEHVAYVDFIIAEIATSLLSSQ